MSIKYDREIISNENHTLKINLSGIKGSKTNITDLKMAIYAYDKNGKPLFSETLYFDEIKILYDYLNNISIIKDSRKTTTGKFIETTDETINILSKIKNINQETLKIFFNKLNEEEIVKILSETLLDINDEFGIPLSEKIISYDKIRAWDLEIQNLETLLDMEINGNIVEDIKHNNNLNTYIAKQPEKIFQNWLSKNVKWIFGVSYIKKHDFRKIAINSEADLLMESMDGFLDFIELKRPKLNVFKFDSNHNCFFPSADLSASIGQCLNYLKEIDEIKLNLEKEHKVKILRPRIKIVIGRTTDFDSRKYDALRMLNCSLNNIEVVTYDYLLSCGYKMIEIYKAH